MDTVNYHPGSSPALRIGSAVNVQSSGKCDGRRQINSLTRDQGQHVITAFESIYTSTHSSGLPAAPLSTLRLARRVMEKHQRHAQRPHSEAPRMADPGCLSPSVQASSHCPPPLRNKHRFLESHSHVRDLFDTGILMHTGSTMMSCIWRPKERI